MNKILLSALVATCSALASLSAQEAAPLLPQPAEPAAPPKVAAPPVAAPAAPPPPKPVPPPADPFVRDARGPKPTAPAAPKVEAPVNLLTTVETWSLSQADFTAILDGPADGRVPYDQLEALAKTGKAQLVGLIAINSKNGQRAVAEAIDEVRYGTRFAPAERAQEIAFPTTFETRNVGDTLEIEPVVGPDRKTIDVNLVPQSVRLEGFQDWRAEASSAPVGQPQFRTEKVTTSTTVISGRPSFLATADAGGAGEKPGAPLIRVRTLRVTAQKAQPSSAPVLEGPIDARVELLIYSLEREAARRVLNDTADSVQSYAAVRELVAKGQAQLEVVSAFVTKSGQRGVNEEIAEYRYPTQMAGPSYASPTTPPEGRQPASPSAFETRNVGVTLEIEPVFGPDARFVDLNVIPQIVRMSGMLKVGGVAGKYPPQPVFTTRKVTTSVSSGAGVPVLLGTMSQPRDNGVNDRVDDGRTSLAYIRVTAVRP